MEYIYFWYIKRYEISIYSTAHASLLLSLGVSLAYLNIRVACSGLIGLVD